MRSFTARAFDVRINSRPTYWYCEPGWEWTSRSLPDHLLWYVMDGVGSIQLDDHVWDLRAGSSFVFAPDARPQGRQDPNRRLVVFGMHFDVVDASGKRVPTTAGMLPPLGSVVRDTSFFATLAQRCDASSRRGDALGALQSRLFLQAMVLHLWEEALYREPSTVELVLDDIIRAIQWEPGHRWTVDELARWAHLSRAQFVRRFRAVAGLSPLHFMIYTRLERARQLMQDTDMTVEQIAYALGYSDVFFFSRQYKRYTGHAPSAFRRR